MEPIASTFGSTSQATLSGSSPLQAEARLRVRQDGVSDGAEASGEARREIGESRQLGIQRSKDSGIKEFSAYAPGSRKGVETSDEGSPGKAAKEAAVQPVVDKTEQDPQVQQQVVQLKSIEAKVKAHEAAHKAAGGAITGPVSYTYTRGPDGRNYVTGGEVPINVSPGKTPQETISRMQQVIRAALAPADPSPQDRSVASQAALEMQKAQQQRSSSLATGNDESSVSTAASEKSADSGQTLAERASRAYSDPSVTGRRDTSGDAPAAEKSRPVSAPAPAVSYRNSGQVSADLSPDMITGFSPQQPTSLYA